METSSIILSVVSHLWTKQLKKDLHDPQTLDGPKSLGSQACLSADTMFGFHITAALNIWPALKWWR